MKRQTKADLEIRLKEAYERIDNLAYENRCLKRENSLLIEVAKRPDTALITAQRLSEAVSQLAQLTARMKSL